MGKAVEADIHKLAVTIAERVRVVIVDGLTEDGRLLPAQISRMARGKAAELQMGIEWALKHLAGAG